MQHVRIVNNEESSVVSSSRGHAQSLATDVGGGVVDVDEIIQQSVAEHYDTADDEEPPPHLQAMKLHATLREYSQALGETNVYKNSLFRSFSTREERDHLNELREVLMTESPEDIQKDTDDEAIHQGPFWAACFATPPAPLIGAPASLMDFNSDSFPDLRSIIHSWTHSDVEIPPQDNSVGESAN